MGRYVEELTGLHGNASCVVETRRFRPELDYVRKRCSTAPHLDVVIGFASRRKGWKKRGGGDGYVEASGQELAQGLLASVQLPPPTRLPLMSNTLRIVLRNEKTAHFVEPPSDTARGSRWDICLGVPLDPFSDDESEESEVAE